MKLTQALLVLSTLSWGAYGYSQNDAPSSFRILDIKTQGTGCRPGTVVQNISSDQKAFTLSFSEFIADLSATTQKKDERKSCRLVFDTEQDKGWEYTVVQVIFRGALYLDAGVNGQLSVRYGTRGKDARSEMNRQGPLDELYTHIDQVSPQGRKWNGCQGNGNGAKNRVRDFTVDSQILLQSREKDRQGFFAVDSVDGDVSQTYQLVWRRCQR